MEEAPQPIIKLTFTNKEDAIRSLKADKMAASLVEIKHYVTDRLRNCKHGILEENECRVWKEINDVIDDIRESNGVTDEAIHFT